MSKDTLVGFHGSLSKFFGSRNGTWVAAVGAALGLIVASFRLPGGDDLYRYYLPFAQGCLDCGYTPYFSQLFFLPLRLLPEYPLAWPFWTIFSVTGILALAYILKANPLLLLISFPMLGQVWLGQVDVIVMLGLTIFLLGKPPLLRGVGVILALTKPQLTALPLLFCLFLESPRVLPALLAVPIFALAASLGVYGFNWIPRWLENSTAGLPVHVWRLASLDIWRAGIFLTPLPFLFRGTRQRLTVGLLVSALATPFYGVYSYLVFLLFENKWQYVLLSYAWLAWFFLLRENALRMAWLLPLGMLIFITRDEIGSRARGTPATKEPQIAGREKHNTKV